MAYEHYSGDRKELEALARSPEAQALFRKLGREEELQAAAASAAAGDSTELRRRIQALLRSPGGADLVERIRRSVQTGHGGF